MTTLATSQASLSPHEEAERKKRAERQQWEKSRLLTRSPASGRTGNSSLGGMANPDFGGKEAETNSGFDHALNVGEQVGNSGGTPSEFSNADQFRDDHSASGKDGTGKSLSGDHGDNITYAGTAFASFGLALSAASAVKIFMDDTSTRERGEALANVGVSAAGMAAAIGSATKVKEGGDKASAATKMADGVLTEIASVAGAMKEGWDLAVKIAKAIQANGDVNSGMEVSEKAGATVDIVKSLLLTSKSAIDTINNFMRHLGHVSTGLVQAAPAIGIAINACDMIINGIGIAESYISMIEMRQQKRDDKEKVLGRKAAKSKGIRGFFGGHESAADQAKATLDAHKQRTSTSPAATEEELTKVRDAEDYLLNKNLQAIAQKRINRGVLNITQNAIAIAGDIAILSGAGAAVGAGLKAGSAGVGIAAAALRIGKQWYHNAKENDPKSEKNKLATYDTMILHIVRNMTEANTALPGTASEGQRQQREDKQELALRQVYASGMTPAKMHAYMPKAEAALKKQAKKEYDDAVKAQVQGQTPALRQVQAAEITTEAGKVLYTDWIAALRKRD